jgi:hypothetical protein
MPQSVICSTALSTIEITCVAVLEICGYIIKKCAVFSNPKVYLHAQKIMSLALLEPF